MSFVPEGGEVFPNLHEDFKDIATVTEWPQAKLDSKLAEYTEFLKRDDLMPRAVKTANWILDRMLFEVACQTGMYQELQNG